jgi:hypothetical protein
MLNDKTLVGLGTWLALIAGLTIYDSSAARIDSNAGQAKAEQHTANTPTPLTANDRIADYTGRLALFTFALVIISSVQIYFLTRSDKTARLSAEAAKGSAETADRALRITQRAFVFAQGFGSGPNIHPSGDGDRVEEYWFFAPVVNVGNTPATNARIRIDTQTFPTIKNREPFFAHPIGGSQAVIGPRIEIKSQYRTVPIEVLLQVWRNEAELYVWTFLEYRDIFDPEVVHHHQQCARIGLIHDPRDIPPADHPPYVTFTIYGPQNSIG